MCVYCVHETQRNNARQTAAAGEEEREWGKSWAKEREWREKWSREKPFFEKPGGGGRRNGGITLTCPCCFVIRLLLDCFPSIGSYCCNHSSVSLQQKKKKKFVRSITSITNFAKCVSFSSRRYSSALGVQGKRASLFFRRGGRRRRSGFKLITARRDVETPTLSKGWGRRGDF